MPFPSNLLEAQPIVQLDATSGSATITNLDQIYAIDAAATLTTVTIPDVEGNEDMRLRLYKESGAGTVRIVTTSGDNIGSVTSQDIPDIDTGFYIIAYGEGDKWFILQDSR